MTGVLVQVLSFVFVGLIVVAIVLAWRWIDKPRREEQALRTRLANGPVGIARVVSSERTGLEVNEHPQWLVRFEVEGAQGEQFHAFTKTFDWRYGMEQGSLHPVRYLPGQAEVVVIDQNAPEALHALGWYNHRRGIGPH